MGILKKIRIIVFAALIGSASLLPCPAYSFELSDGLRLLQISLEYGMIYSYLKHLDGSGRNYMLEILKKEHGVNNDQRANHQLSIIMASLQKTIMDSDPDLASKPYNFFVNQQKSFNAFCSLGHNISVNIGLFEALDYDEDETAFVVAHELAHGQNGDPFYNQIKRTSISALASLITGGSGSSLDIIAMSVASGAARAKLVTLPAEKKADRKAFEYCANSGYNPGAGAALWQRVMEQIDKNPANFLLDIFSDHPGNESRRDLYAKDMTAWSMGAVSVDSITGMIMLNGKSIYAPVAYKGKSGLERAYLAAGRIAGVYHGIDSLVHVPQASFIGRQVFLGDVMILETAPGEDAGKISQAINVSAGKN